MYKFGILYMYLLNVHKYPNDSIGNDTRVLTTCSHHCERLPTGSLPICKDGPYGQELTSLHAWKYVPYMYMYKCTMCVIKCNHIERCMLGKGGQPFHMNCMCSTCMYMYMQVQCKSNVQFTIYSFHHTLNYRLSKLLINQTSCWWCTKHMICKN